MRKIVMHTGLEGAKRYHNALEEHADEVMREQWRRRARSLYSYCALNAEELDAYIKLINSPDRENLTLAEELIRIKESEHYGNPIHSVMKEPFFGSPNQASEWSFWYMVLVAIVMWIAWKEFKSIKFKKDSK